MSARRAGQQAGVGRQLALVAVVLGLSGAAVGLVTAGESHRSTADAQRLWSTGHWTRADSAEIRVEMRGVRHRHEVAEVTAVVAFAGGVERRVTLSYTSVDTEGLPRDEWIPAEAWPYVDSFDVVYDPHDQDLVMAGADASYWRRYGADDVRTSVWVAGVAIVWSAAWAPFAWPRRAGSRADAPARLTRPRAR